MPSVFLARVVQPSIQLFKRLTTIQPKEAKFTVGVDIGSTSVKAIALGPRKGVGARPIIGQQLVPLSEGQEADASEAIKTAVAALSVPTRSVTLSVSGQWVVMRVVELPQMKPAEMKQALPFEAQRYLPFNIQDVVIDGSVLGPAEENKAWVLIVACKRDLLERRMDWAKRAGLDVTLIDVDALALTNSFLASSGGRRSEGTRAIINVGAQLTNLVVFRGNIPYLVRDIPWGGDKFARGAAEQSGLDPELVRKQLAEGTSGPEMLAALKAGSEALVTELQLSFDYFENRFGQPPEEVLVTGGLGLSASFLEALKGHLTQTVTGWTPVQGLSAQMTIAYGLALRTG